MRFILDNIDKVKCITLQKEEDFEGTIQIGFTATPPHDSDSNIAEISLLLGFKNVEDDSKIIDYIGLALMGGIKVAEEGFDHFLSAMAEKQ